MNGGNKAAIYALITGVIVVATAMIILIVTFGIEKKQVVNHPGITLPSAEKLTTKDSGIKVELPGADWATHGGDLYNRRYSVLETITTKLLKI